MYYEFSGDSTAHWPRQDQNRFCVTLNNDFQQHAHKLHGASEVWEV